MDRLNRTYVLNLTWVFVFLFLTVWQVRIDTFLPWFFGVGFAWFLAVGLIRYHFKHTGRLPDSLMKNL